MLREGADSSRPSPGERGGGGWGALGAVQQLPAETSQRRKKNQTEMKFFAQGQQIHRPFSPLLPALPPSYGPQEIKPGDSTAERLHPQTLELQKSGFESWL